jgi:large subunit ribosomal protein L15
MNLTKLHSQVKPRPNAYRKGRGPGSGTGTYAGRGSKGYHARAGSKRNPIKEGGQMPLYRRTPKRGFSNAPFEVLHVEVGVGELNRFEDGSVVTQLELKATGLVKGKFDIIRVLKTGEVTKRIEVHAHHFSAAAKADIEAKGGKCVLISLPILKKKKQHRARGGFAKPKPPVEKEKQNPPAKKETKKPPADKQDK